jgi:hypothetical protein
MMGKLALVLSLMVTGVSFATKPPIVQGQRYTLTGYLCIRSTSGNVTIYLSNFPGGDPPDKSAEDCPVPLTTVNSGVKLLELMRATQSSRPVTLVGVGAADGTFQVSKAHKAASDTAESIEDSFPLEKAKADAKKQFARKYLSAKDPLSKPYVKNATVDSKKGFITVVCGTFNSGEPRLADLGLVQYIYDGEGNFLSAGNPFLRN